MKNIIIIIVIAVIAIVGLGIGMSRMNSESTNGSADVVQQTSEMTDTSTTQNTTEGTTSEVRTIAVEGGSFYYKPNEVRVKKGEKVKIVLSSKDMMHDFVIDELNVKTPVVPSGETGTVEFTADQTGTFEYYCSVGNHRQQGQIGKLIVE